MYRPQASATPGVQEVEQKTRTVKWATDLEETKTFSKNEPVFAEVKRRRTPTRKPEPRNALSESKKQQRPARAGIDKPRADRNAPQGNTETKTGAAELLEHVRSLADLSKEATQHGMHAERRRLESAARELKALADVLERSEKKKPRKQDKEQRTTTKAVTQDRSKKTKRSAPKESGRPKKPAARKHAARPVAFKTQNRFAALSSSSRCKSESKAQKRKEAQAAAAPPQRTRPSKTSAATNERSDKATKKSFRRVLPSGDQGPRVL